MRLIPLPLHSAIEMLLGIAVGTVPFALGLGAGAAVVGVVAGALLVGLALQSVDTGTGGGVAISAHLAGDQGLALGLAAAGVVMAVSDQAVAAGLFAAVAIAHLLLILATHYTAR